MHREVVFLMWIYFNLLWVRAHVCMDQHFSSSSLFSIIAQQDSKRNCVKLWDYCEYFIWLFLGYASPFEVRSSFILYFWIGHPQKCYLESYDHLTHLCNTLQPFLHTKNLECLLFHPLCLRYMLFWGLLECHTFQNLLFPSKSCFYDMQGNIARWLKKEGDKVSPGEVLCEVETVGSCTLHPLTCWVCWLRICILLVLCASFHDGKLTCTLYPLTC